MATLPSQSCQHVGGGIEERKGLQGGGRERRGETEKGIAECKREYGRVVGRLQETGGKEGEREGTEKRERVRKRRNKRRGKIMSKRRAAG